MADVSPLSDRAERSGDDRGQLILITGFALAFILVAIVLLLNTVIYTENIASRGLDRSADEALEYRGGAIEGVGDILIEMNQDGYNETAFTNEVRNLSEMLLRGYIDRGTLAGLNASAIDATEGRLLIQTNASRQFVNASGTENWTVATNVDKIRRVQFTPNTSTSIPNATAATAATADVFQFTVNGSSNSWTVYIYENESTAGTIEVATATDDQPPQRQCQVRSSDPIVDLTAGTVGDTACSNLTWARGVTGEYNLTIRNGSSLRGAFTLTVAGSNPPVSANFNSGPTADAPQVIDAAYSVSLPMYFETPSLVYETWIRVAPGEPDA